MSNQTEVSQRLTTGAAASYLGLSAATLEKFRCSGGGPKFLKLGRAVRYDRADLDDWLASRRRCSTSDPGANPANTGARNG